MSEKRLRVVPVQSRVPSQDENNGSADEQKGAKEEIARE
jgi:hypothetical protein